MSSEAIATVIADLRAARVRRMRGRNSDGEEFADDDNMWNYASHVASVPGPTIDATTIYESLVARDDPVALYEDHPCIAPPWENAAVCYRNEHGNVVAMTTHALPDPFKLERNELRDAMIAEIDKGRSETQPGPWQPAQPVDWDRVRWQIDTFVWLGGRGGNGTFPTSGPLHHWQFAIYENGEPADLHWVQLQPDYPMEHWDMAHLVLLGALNFCNCRNVELVEPKRPRAEARRIARTGIRVSTINVFPAGRSTRAAKAAGSVGTPLTSVRGHFATYGPEYGRGLLFGKYSGRFWIPQHARGDSSLGVVQSDYVLHG